MRVAPMRYKKLQPVCGTLEQNISVKHTNLQNTAIHMSRYQVVHRSWISHAAVRRHRR